MMVTGEATDCKGGHIFYERQALARRTAISVREISSYFIAPDPRLLQDLDSAIPNADNARFGEARAKFLAWIIAPYRPRWSPDFYQTCSELNSYLEDKQESLPLFQRDGMKVDRPDDGEALKRARALSPRARIHFMYALSRLTPGDVWHERGGNVLSDLTTYKMRKRGIDGENTSEEIISSGLVEYSTSRAAYMHFLLKDDLIAGCKETGTVYTKSWRKAEIIDALQSNAPDYLPSIMQEKGVVTIRSEHEHDLLELNRYGKRLQQRCVLLAYLNSGTHEKIDPKTYQEALEEYKRAGISRVAILSQRDSDVCHPCRELDGKEYGLEEAIEKQLLPHDGCTSERCRCTYRAVAN